MGSELRLSEELGSEPSHSESPVLEIAYRELDYASGEDAAVIGPALVDFHKLVNGEDIDSVITLGGVPFHRAELKLQQHFGENAKINIATHQGVCIGFLVYHLIADCILFIRQIYVYPEWVRQRIAANLVKSIRKPVKRVIFQTRKKNEPTQLLLHVSKHAQKVYETDLVITWEMEWKDGDSTS